MRILSDLTSIVETRNVDDEMFEVCATGRATYDDAASQLSMTLDSFVRRVNLRGHDDCLKPDWLPSMKPVSDKVSLEEAHAEAKEVFSRWVRRIRESIPGRESFAESIRA